MPFNKVNTGAKGFFPNLPVKLYFLNLIGYYNNEEGKLFFSAYLTTFITLMSFQLHNGIIEEDIHEGKNSSTTSWWEMKKFSTTTKRRLRMKK